MNTNSFKVGERAQFVGVVNGKQCNFPVVLREQNPHVPECFGVDAVFADNVLYTPDNWCHTRDLRKLHQSWCPDRSIPERAVTCPCNTKVSGTVRISGI